MFLAAVVGCQRGGDANQPAAAVNGPAGAGGPASPAEPAPPKSDQDPSHPIVQVETTLGTFKIRLDAERAAITVDNFLNYVAAKHYDDTIFHEIRSEYPKLILGGGYAANFTEKKGRTPIRNEAHNGLKNRRYTVAMAHQPDNEDSATCHFFINLSDNTVLDYKDRTPQGYGYCVFGEVVEGVDIVDKIGQAPVHDVGKLERTPVETIAIKSIRRIK
jgi:cyclophilin family peptidyl-prolyl cis-trans isomerase